MTKRLEEAIERLRRLPEADQDSIAQIVFDELESERKWDELFTKSPEKLKRLGDQAWADYEAGKTDELDPEKL
jgi:hypothetical protein